MNVVLPLGLTETAVPTAGLDVPLGVILVSVTVELVVVNVTVNVQLLVTGPTLSARLEPRYQVEASEMAPHPPFQFHAALLTPAGGVTVKVVLPFGLTETAVPTAGLDAPLGATCVSVTVGLVTVNVTVNVQLLVTGPTLSGMVDPMYQVDASAMEPHPPFQFHTA